MSKKDSAEYSCSWKNGILWACISLGAALLIHVAVWNYAMWQNDPDVFYDEFCLAALGLMIVQCLLPVLTGVLSYQGYRRIAANHSIDLHGVAHGSYGRPWIVPGILLIAMEVVWLIISMAVMGLGLELSWTHPTDRIVLSMFLTIYVVSAVVDGALYLVGAFVFKPNQVRAAQ